MRDLINQFLIIVFFYFDLIWRTSQDCNYSWVFPALAFPGQSWSQSCTSVFVLLGCFMCYLLSFLLLRVIVIFFVVLKLILT